MKLSRPAAPFERVELHGESFTLDTSGKVLVLPTANAAILPSFNQSVLNSDRLTIAESPFGGLKTGSPDYCPGTLYTATDGVNLTDVNGQNSTKTLTAGMLKGVNGLTVDPVARTITQEFIVENTAESNNPTVIDACDSATGWSHNTAPGGSISEISFEDGRLKIVGTTSASGSLAVYKDVAFVMTGFALISFSIESSLSGNIRLSTYDASNVWRSWEDPRFGVPANVITKFQLAHSAPVAAMGNNPSFVGTNQNPSYISRIVVGVYRAAPNTAITFYIDNITADVAKSAYIELQIPDNLSATSATLFTHNGTQYLECRSDSLDGAYSNVSQTSANATLADGTKFDDVYGAGLGRAVYPKGESGETKNGSIGSITYSANQGTLKRIGYRFDLPPDDGGRTNFNKIRLKTILTYAPDAEDNYSASYDFADSTNTSYGLQNLSKPWIALYDPANSLIDFYLFTHRPQNLSFKRDETGTIHEVTLYPGNGLIYHGQITYANLTADSNSDGIPDCLEASVEGSLTKFLQAYGMVI